MTTKISNANLDNDSIVTGNITDGTIVNADVSPSAAIASSKVSGAITSSDLDSLNYNVGVLGFKQAVSESLTIFNLVDGIVDEFNSSGGISASPNLTYDTPGDFYTNQGSPQTSTVDISNQSGRTTSGSVYTAGPNPGTGTLSMYLWGGGGAGPQQAGRSGGGGGHSSGSTPVTSGGTFSVIIAGGGGWNTGHRSGGGGLTGVFPNPTFPVSPATSFNNAILIAGGGGGSGNEVFGGGGGGSTGGPAPNVTGGSQNAGGPGPLGQGGKLYGGGPGAQGNLSSNPGGTGGYGGGANATNNETCGGGSGYYGGGASQFAGGAGGSGYIGGSPNFPISSGSQAQGQTGNGRPSSDPAQTASPFYPSVPGSGQGSQQTASGGGLVTQIAVQPFNSSGTLTSATFTASSAPTTARIVVFMETAGETLNTDIIAKVSRDNGSNYTNATLVDSGYVTGASGTKIYVDTVDISGQPSGTSMKYQVALSGIAGQVKIHGVSLVWG